MVGEKIKQYEIVQDPVRRDVSTHELMMLFYRLRGIVSKNVYHEEELKKIIVYFLRKRYGNTHQISIEKPFVSPTLYRMRTIDITFDNVFIELKVLARSMRGKYICEKFAKQLRFYKEFTKDIILIVYERETTFDIDLLPKDVFNSIDLIIFPNKKVPLTIDEEMNRLYDTYDLEPIIILKDKLRRLKGRRLYQIKKGKDIDMNKMAYIDDAIKFVSGKIEEYNAKKPEVAQTIRCV